MPVEPHVLADLAAPTPEGEVKQRKAQAKGGRPVYKNGQPLMLDYVTARYVQQRLDDVVGPENWTARFAPLSSGAVECTLGIFIWTPDGDGKDASRVGVWVTKADVGVASMIEPQKGAYSDAFKRAAVHWGIARDLYEERDETEVAVASPPTSSIRDRVAGWDEEEEEPQSAEYGDYDSEPTPARRPAPRRTAAPVRRGAGNGRRFVPRETRQSDDDLMALFNPNDPPWACPVHGEVRVQPGGISRKSGKRYGPFLVCEAEDCDERGPFLSDALREQGVL